MTCMPNLRQCLINLQNLSKLYLQAVFPHRQTIKRSLQDSFNEVSCSNINVNLHSGERALRHSNTNAAFKSGQKN